MCFVEIKLEKKKFVYNVFVVKLSQIAAIRVFALVDACRITCLVLRGGGVRKTEVFTWGRGS